MKKIAFAALLSTTFAFAAATEAKPADAATTPVAVEAAKTPAAATEAKPADAATTPVAATTEAAKPAEVKADAAKPAEVKADAAKK